MRTLFVPALLSLMLVAFAGPPHALAQASLPAEITGSTWELVSLTPAGSAAEDTTGGGITLAFGSENMANGSGGCNNYRSSYTTTGAGSITFAQTASTLMACPEPQGSREGRFFMALEAVSSYRLDGGRLTLSADDGAELVFTAQASSATGKTAPTAPATLPSTGGEHEAVLWLALAAAVLGGAGLVMRRRAFR